MKYNLRLTVLYLGAPYFTYYILNARKKDKNPKLIIHGIFN